MAKKETIGQRLRILRGHRTQAAVAAQLDVARNTVSRWEGGLREPRLSELVRLIELYDAQDRCGWLLMGARDGAA